MSVARLESVDGEALRWRCVRRAVGGMARSEEEEERGVDEISRWWRRGEAARNLWMMVSLPPWRVSVVRDFNETVVVGGLVLGWRSRSSSICSLR